MISLDYGVLEELERHLAPLLEAAGFPVESLQAIGMLGRGGSGSVFSLHINNHYYVIKIYTSHAAYVRERRNWRRLVWPPEVILAVPAGKNPLGYDIVVTAVPQGVSFNSTNLQEWVADKLSERLIEMHRVRRARTVSVASLRRAVADVAWGATQAAASVSDEARLMVEGVVVGLGHFLDTKGQIMRVQPSLLHNDLWWDNIIIARDDVYLIDWEWVKLGDYAEDLAYARVMLGFVPVYDRSHRFWQGDPDDKVANRFFYHITDTYSREFEDMTLDDRMRFYLSLQTLRRLSDYFAGAYKGGHHLRDYWLERLPGFWQDGLIGERVPDPILD